MDISARLVGRTVLVSRLRKLGDREAMDTITHKLAQDIFAVSKELAPHRTGALKNSHDVVRARGGGWALKIRANHAGPVMAGHNQPRGPYNFVAEAMSIVLGDGRNGTLTKAMAALIAARGLGR